MVPVVVGSNPIIHPMICESGGIGRRAGFRYQYLWCESSSLSSRNKAYENRYKNWNFNRVSTSGCSKSQEIKILSMDDSKPVYLRQKKNALILLKINVIKILRFFEKNW